MKKEINRHEQQLKMQIEKQTLAINTAQEALETLKGRYPYLDETSPHKQEYAVLIEDLKSALPKGEKALMGLREALHDLEVSKQKVFNAV